MSISAGRPFQLDNSNEEKVLLIGISLSVFSKNILEKQLNELTIRIVMEEKNYCYLESNQELGGQSYILVYAFSFIVNSFLRSQCTAHCMFFYELVLNLCEVSGPSLNLIKEGVNMIGISCSHSLETFQGMLSTNKREPSAKRMRFFCH